MIDGLSKTLAITDSVDNEVTSVAISSDGRLVAAGSRSTVRYLQSSVGIYSECNSCRRYVSGTLAPVNCWRRCGDTEVSFLAWRSPLMDVDW